MIYSQIITGGGEAERQLSVSQLTKKYLNISWPQAHPDLLILKPIKDVLTIAQVRELKAKLALRPYSAPLKLAVILEAEKLTLAAQNALLKTLEEPPDRSLILLITAFPDLLLPTILSRCRLVNSGPAKTFTADEKEIKIQQKILPQLITAKAGERLKIVLAGPYNREQAIKTILAQLYLFRQNLRQNPAKNTVANLKSCQTALRQIEANLNHYLVLGNLFLSYSAPKTD